MKMLILHIHNTYNYGSFMMGINFLYYFSKIYPGTIFEVELNTQKDHERIRKELGENVKVVEIRKKQPRGILNKILYKIEETFIEPEQINKRKYDAIIILGGDDLSKYYSWKVIFPLLKICLLSKKNKIFLVGQTIGPFLNWQKILAKHCLKSTIIYLRDPLCAKYINEELRLSNFSVSSDLAFLDLPFLREEILLSYSLERGKYITIIPSGLTEAYTVFREKYINCWEKIIKNLLWDKRLKSYKLVLLAHVLKPKKVSDKNVIDEIYSKLSLKEKKRILKITDELLPSQARSVLGGGFFSVSGRMHGAVSTFQRVRPSISLSYGIKYEGVIGMTLKRQDLIIEAKEDDLWRRGKIVQKINDKIDYLLNNYERINKETGERIAVLKDIAAWQIEDIAKKIRPL